MQSVKFHISNLKTPLELKFNQFVKRFFDIIFSFLLVILFIPIFFIISILIKATSKGDILFVQERITRGNKVFKIYKFRTMIEDAEGISGPIFAKNNDPRCTKIGNILRKLSLDETPQFFNVLKGDMSLIGPRPERPFYIKKFETEIFEYNQRHLVKAGITGLAQIKGFRGQTSIEERVKYDIEYIKNWSILLDLKIVVKTMFLILNDLIKFILKIT